MTEGSHDTMEDHPLPDSLLDKNGRIARWPRKERDRMAVLRRLAAAFVPGREYTEAEVNACIAERTCDGDHALLRREMFQRGLLDRELDGSRYRRTAR